MNGGGTNLQLDCKYFGAFALLASSRSQDVIVPCARLVSNSLQSKRIIQRSIKPLLLFVILQSARHASWLTAIVRYTSRFRAHLMKISTQTFACSLVADIGGTNTRVALAQGSNVIEESIRSYSNAEHRDIVALLSDYRANAGNIDCGMACVAVAGPVRDDIAEFTNLDWRIDARSVTQATGASTVAILNDLQAAGHMLGRICSFRLHEVIEQPEAAPDATQLLIGIGTGFNAVAVYHLASGSFVAPAESGHVNMPVCNPDDLELAQFICETRGFADVEEVLSGRGMENIYAWHQSRESAPSNASASEIIQALAASDRRAELVLRTFVRLLGVCAGNFALSTLPFGGIYLAGGVARAIAPYLLEFDFVTAFRNKGRFSELMQNFGVSVIQDDYAALTGCAVYLAEQFGRKMQAAR